MCDRGGGGFREELLSLWSPPRPVLTRARARSCLSLPPTRTDAPRALSLAVSLPGHPSQRTTKRSFASSYARRRAAASSSSGAMSTPPPPLVVKPVADAHALLKSGAPYLDVRTPGEFAAGRPPGAINVDFLGSAGPEDFLAAVEKALPKDEAQAAVAVIVGCKSGGRSARAAAVLSQAGYPAALLVDVGGGFDAWSAAGLPVEEN
jgi:rhodanese-related sulfurtransferase